MEYEKKYTVAEEIANAITHGVGTIASVAVLVLLIIAGVRQRSSLMIVSFCIYGAGNILMYLFSTLYHALTHRKAKAVFRVLDHSGIFFCIAGTYTPLIMLTLDGAMRIIVLSLMWAAAIVGIVFTCVWHKDMNKNRIINTVIYIAMGWVAVFMTKNIIDTAGIRFLLWIIAGGVLYTIGTIFYINKKIMFNHAIWHIFVMLGSAMHMCGIMIYLTK